MRLINLHYCLDVVPDIRKSYHECHCLPTTAIIHRNVVCNDTELFLSIAQRIDGFFLY